MATMDVPKIVIKAIDHRRRAFFWTEEHVCHGSKCLVAWEDICVSKDNGGLGVKDLEQQNRSLLMKFIGKHPLTPPLMGLNPICGKLLAMNLILTDLSLM
jgi:hypothetical protein